MKRILISLMLIIALTTLVYSSEFYLISNVKQNKEISLYNSPQNGRELAVLGAGDIFEIVQKDEDGNRLVLDIDGNAGWISNDIFEKTSLVNISDRGLQRYYSDSVRNEERSDFDISKAEASPLIITVSLKGLTLHAKCALEGFDKVYPVGVGVKDKYGKSITPTSSSQNKEFFMTCTDRDNGWYYMKRRWSPQYFGGFPFIRLNVVNRKNQHTYGFHGPITKNKLGNWYLQRGYVSHGCMRMRGEDCQELYEMAHKYAGARVYIIEDYEYDEDGNIVDCDYPRW